MNIFAKIAQLAKVYYQIRIIKTTITLIKLNCFTELTCFKCPNMNSIQKINNNFRYDKIFQFVYVSPLSFNILLKSFRLILRKLNKYLSFLIQCMCMYIIFIKKILIFYESEHIFAIILITCFIYSVDVTLYYRRIEKTLVPLSRWPSTTTPKGITDYTDNFIYLY